MSELWEYTKAVGPGWYVALVLLMSVTDNVLDHFGFRSVFKNLDPKFRHPIKNLIMICLALYVGYHAWQDVTVKFNTAELRRENSQYWLAVWKTRASTDDDAIHSPRGYLAQISALKTKLAVAEKKPRAATKQVAAEWDVIPGTYNAIDPALITTVDRTACETKLKVFESQLDQLLNRNLPRSINPTDFKAFSTEVYNWVNETHEWILRHMGEKAASLFFEKEKPTKIIFDQAVNAEHNQIIILLTKYRKNLNLLILSGYWDDPNSSCDVER